MTHPLDNYRIINKSEVEMLTKQLKQAITYCRDAQSTDHSDLHQDPTRTYPGASGYAGSCMQMVLESLEHSIDCASLFDS